jgi:serine/threonine protein kinase
MEPMGRLCMSVQWSSFERGWLDTFRSVQDEISGTFSILRYYICWILQLGAHIAVKQVPRLFEKVSLAKRAVREVTLLRHFSHHENITGLIGEPPFITHESCLVSSLLIIKTWTSSLRILTSCKTRNLDATHCNEVILEDFIYRYLFLEVGFSRLISTHSSQSATAYGR